MSVQSIDNYSSSYQCLSTFMTSFSIAPSLMCIALSVAARGHRCYLFGHRCYFFTSFIFFCYNPCCCPCALGIASSAALIMGSGKLLSFSTSVNSSWKLYYEQKETGLASDQE